jgi:hypothetical protein
MSERLIGMTRISSYLCQGSIELLRPLSLRFCLLQYAGENCLGNVYRNAINGNTLMSTLNTTVALKSQNEKRLGYFSLVMAMNGWTMSQTWTDLISLRILYRYANSQQSSSGKKTMNGRYIKIHKIDGLKAINAFVESL